MNGDDTIYARHNGLIHKTPQAYLFDIQGRQIWMPKVAVDTYNDQIVAIKRWFAKKERIMGDW